MPSEFAYESAKDLKARILKREISPVEVVQASLDRLEATEDKCNAFVTVSAERALEAAKRAEKRIADGDDPGMLAGLPVSIKDILPVKGLPWTLGSRAMAENIAEFDTPVAGRLDAAGAALIGKTATDEFGCTVVGNSPLNGQTCNPWDLSKIPGGSSAGAAASVAAGVTPFAIGTDGGGSVRIPGSLTNLFALKPQHGRIPIYPPPLAPSLFHVGPMSRTVRDAALLLEAVAGYDARDAFSVSQPMPDMLAACEASPSGLRIAWSPTLGYASPDPDVLAIVEESVKALETLGCTVEQVDDVFAEDPFPTWAGEFYAGGATRMKDMIANQPEQIGDEVREAFIAASGQTVEDYCNQVFSRFALRERIRVFFERFDLLATPSLPVAPFDTGTFRPPEKPDAAIIGWTQYGYPFNITGNPAATVPAGFTDAGLPIGLQLVAPALNEADIFTAAAALEAERPWADRRPPLV